MSKYTSVANILDVDKFDPDNVLPRQVYGSHGIYNNARERLLNLLQEQRHTEALTLLHALLDSKKYVVARYWKVGAELVQELAPEGLADYLEMTFVSSKRATMLPTFYAWIQQLIKTGQVARAKEELDFRVEREPFASDLRVRKALAMIMYEEWCQSLDRNTEKKTRSVYYCLQKAYEVGPNDVHVLQAYLEVMTQLGLDVTSVVEKTLSNCAMDPYRQSVLLKYITDDALKKSLLEGICRLDPSADADVALDPLLDLIQARETSALPETVYLAFELILDRLEHGIADDWTLNTLLGYLQALDQRIDNTRTEVIKMAQARSVNDSLDFLQGHCDSSTSHSYITLQSIREKFNPIQEVENNGPRVGKIVEYDQDDPWHSFLFDI
ncbi:hypothetical protein DFQ28_000273 [Apophysomyces sp. BC1034]|nr:hypothetical protein DFQ30_008122 [Apophysomyces sp. BC1015]KAG0182257.1 hypothetical protein DFQ29_005140 [Apophysomyces sp. BC1021]KAG0191387.1 hypothetical protein DFQ28_000273 [Apophysomyces sp. BC1034]